MPTVFLSLGSNTGDRRKNLLHAAAMLEKSGIRILSASGIYETEPFGRKGQPDFLNACLKTDTSLEPQALLAAVKAIEAGMGRENTGKWGPRNIDIDILFYDNIIIKYADLVIPHPGIQARKFVLLPFSEIAAGFTHPENGLTAAEMLEKGDFAEKAGRLGEFE